MIQALQTAVLAAKDLREATSTLLPTEALEIASLLDLIDRTLEEL